MHFLSNLNARRAASCDQKDEEMGKCKSKRTLELCEEDKINLKNDGVLG